MKQSNGIMLFNKTTYRHMTDGKLTLPIVFHNDTNRLHIFLIQGTEGTPPPVWVKLLSLNQQKPMLIFYGYSNPRPKSSLIYHKSRQGNT